MFQPSKGLVAALGIVLAFSTLLSRVPLNQTDVWLHLGFGLQWLDAGCLDPANLTPIAQPGAPGINSYWLSQCAIGLAWNAGGVAGIQALHAMAVLIRLLALCLLLKACSVPDRRLVLVVVVTLGLALGHAPVFRPQVFAEAFATPFLILLLWPSSGLLPWFLAGLLLGAWGLFHGSVLMGFPLAAAVALGQAIQGDSIRGKVLPLGRMMALLCVAGLILALLHPSGLSALGEALAMGAGRAVRLQDEWRPLWTNQSPFPLLLWGASVTWWAWGMAVAGKKGAFPWQCLIPGLLLAAIPLIHQRLLVWWFLAAPILVARAFPPEGAPFPPVSWRSAAWLGVAAVSAIVVSGPMNAAWGNIPEGRLVARATPVALADALARSVEPIESNRKSGLVFASETLGDFLAWRWKPRAPVLLHSHVHLLPPDHYDACVRVKWTLPGWEEQLDHWGVDLVLVEPVTHPRLCAKLRQKPGWTVILDESERVDMAPRSRLFAAVRDSSGFKVPLAGQPIR